MMKLHVIVTSTRPQRAGLPIGKWFFDVAKAHGKFDARFVDLLEVNLPLFDEPQHPRLGQYEHAHTRAWSELVSEADAFVFVLPEYNYGMPPSFVNAMTYLSREWAYKASAFVSYGGVSGGTRAAQMAKQLLTAVKVMPIPEAVIIPMYSQHMEEGRFKGGERFEKSAHGMLDELLRWTAALKTMRG